MTYPVFNIFYSFLSALALFFTAWRIQLYYWKSFSLLAKHFRDMSFSAGVGSLIQAFVFLLFFNDPIILGVGAIIGGVFVFIAHVFGVVIFFHLVFPTIPSIKILTIGLLLVAVVTLCHIKLIPQPEINESGLIEFNFLPFTKIVFFAFSTVGLLPLGIAFIHEAITTERLRIRSGFSAFAFLFLALANGLQAVVGPPLYALAFIFLPSIAYIMLVAAVILRVEAPPTE